MFESKNLRIAKLTVLFCLISVGSLAESDEQNQQQQQLEKEGQRKTKKPLEKEDWEGIHYKIFTVQKDINRLEPEETRELLVKLNEIYKPYSNQETNGRKEKIQILLDSSEIKLENCYRERFEGYDTLKSYFDVYWRNILPYLHHYERKLLDLCEADPNEVLHLNVREHLSDQKYHKRMEDLVEFMMNANNTKGYHGSQIFLRHATLCERSILLGVINFVEDKLDNDEEWIDKADDAAVKCYSLKTRDTLKKDLSHAFDQLIMDTCKRWIQAVDPYYALVKLNVNAVLRREEEIWVENYAVCDRIIANRKYIEKELYKHIRNRGSILHKFKKSQFYTKTSNKLDIFSKYRAYQWEKFDRYHRERAAKFIAETEADDRQLSDKEKAHIELLLHPRKKST